LGFKQLIFSFWFLFGIGDFGLTSPPLWQGATFKNLILGLSFAKLTTTP